MKLAERFDIKEILRFLVGGGSAVATDFAAYYLLMAAGVAVNPAKATSYALGAAVGFVINKLWTFQSKRFKPSELVKYIALYIFSAFANAFANRVALTVTGIKLFAFLFATGVSTVINFLGQKFFVFRKKEAV